MFGTLHWNAPSQETDYVPRQHGSSNLEKHSACDRCRAKKVLTCGSRVTSSVEKTLRADGLGPLMQVKCSINHDQCSRCKRRGELCTFTSIRHKSIHRSLKPSIIAAPQEPSESSSFQSSASSSLKCIEPGKGDCSDERTYMPPHQTDGNVNGVS